MKTVLGIAIMLIGIVVGLYAGLWWAFVGGIVQIVQAVQATPIDGMTVALSIVRIIFSSFIGVVSAFLFFLPGVALFAPGSSNR